MSFTYRDGQLAAERVPLARIAAAVGTPAYVYSSALLEAGYRRYAAAFADVDATICYAMKANSNLAVVGTFGALGAGADVVSGGELARALAAGIDPGRIVFAGVGKTPDEMARGLAAGILQFNVESEPELEALAATARRAGRIATVAIRVNPDVDAETHAKITTGRAGDKFGIDIDQAPALFERARRLEGIDIAGVAVHIGSQLTRIAPFEAAFARAADLVRQLRAAGHGIRRVDLGGGLGISYRDETPPDLDRYAQAAKALARDLGCALVLEPGRWLVGNAGVLLAKVVYVKDGSAKRFVILDAAMNDLIRPALYDAWHEIRPVIEPAPGFVPHLVDVVGPVCESTDTFARDRAMPPLAADDLVAFLSAGAYGAVMASSYNSRPLPPEVLVRDDQFAVIKPRPAVTDLFADEALPPWLAVPASSGSPPR